MIGDEIVVKEHHTRSARKVVDLIRDKISSFDGRVVITVAGESGSGKSETASEIVRLLKEKEGVEYRIFHQDDYFVYPPHTNADKRKEDISHVGMDEVKLELLDKHLKEAKDPMATTIEKPLVDFHKDEILSETFDLTGVKVLVAEGTYTTALENADIRVFIDKTFHDTLSHRQERARDEIDEFTDKILSIEHDIISKQKEKADIIIPKEE